MHMPLRTTGALIPLLLSIPARASTTTTASSTIGSLLHHRIPPPSHPFCPSNTTICHYSTTPTMSQKPEDNNTQHQKGPEADGQGAGTEESSPYLALPDANNAQTSHTLDVSGEGGSTVKLDHLGPLVVNQDGTLSRISNWEQMTEIERRNTLRVLGKRNKQRMEALKAKGV